MDRTTAFRMVTIGMVCTLVGVIAGALLTFRAPPQSLQREAVDGEFVLTAQDFYDPLNAEARLTTIPGASVRTFVSGTITRLDCVPGETWVSGTSPLSIDGVPLLAVATVSPLWRDLAIGSRGDDVAALQQLLRDGGSNVAVDGLFGRDTAAALNELLSTIGAPADGSLKRSAHVWLPDAQTTIEACTATVGEQVDPNTVIAATPKRITSAQLTFGSDQFVAGPRVFQIGSLQVEIDASFLITSQEDLALLTGGPIEDAFPTSSEESETLQGIIALRQPIRVFSVPPSALVFDDDISCLVSDGEPKAVEILGSALGETIVQFLSAAPQSVSLRPDILSCR